MKFLTHCRSLFMMFIVNLAVNGRKGESVKIIIKLLYYSDTRQSRLWQSGVLVWRRHPLPWMGITIDCDVHGGAGEQRNLLELVFSPLSPHDALKHHLTSLKTNFIFLQARVLEWKFPWNWFTNTWQFITYFKSSSCSLLHVEKCGSNSRLVVDEDDNVKSCLKGLKKNNYWFTFVFTLFIRSLLFVDICIAFDIASIKNILIIIMLWLIENSTRDDTNVQLGITLSLVYL